MNIFFLRVLNIKFVLFTVYEGPARIHYKCLVPIYVFQEMKLCSLLISKQNFNVLSPNSYTHISVRELYISRNGQSILLQPNMWTDPGNICINRSHSHECTVGIGRAIPFLGIHKLNFRYSVSMSSDGFHNSWLVFLEKKSKIKYLQRSKGRRYHWSCTLSQGSLPLSSCCEEYVNSVRGEQIKGRKTISYMQGAIYVGK
jgi:hypothetical protein